MINTTHTDPKVLRDYGFLMGAFIVVAFGIYPWLVLKKTIVMWPFVCSLAFGFIAIFYPKVLGPVYRVWMWVGQFLGRINSAILLTFCYGALFVPMAFVFRCMKRDRLHRTVKQQENSFRVLREQHRNVKQMELPF